MDLVPARMINEVLYCERLMYLEWVQGEWEENYFTVDGQGVHKRANQAGRPLTRPPRDGHDPSTESEPQTEPTYTARSVWLTSNELGITTKIDVVDVEGGKVVPIEYKRGKRPDVPGGAYLPERAQVCAQVLVLREHGFECDHGEIYFAKDKQRHRIEIDDELIQTTRRAAARCRELSVRGEIPPPLENSPKCDGCSLVGICLPDETNSLARSTRYQNPYADADEVGDDPWGLVGESTDEASETPGNIRRLFPARDDKVPLYVQAQGATVRLDGERLLVHCKGESTVTARLPNTSHVALYGNVHLTTPALRGLLTRSVPVLFMTYGGWYQGRTIGADSKNVELRLAQYARTQDSATCLHLARGFVASKILNSRTLLRRNHQKPNAVTLSELKQLARKARSADSLESLLGIEGTAARSYFKDFSGMLKGDAHLCGDFDFGGRNRRPPRDPINALLSFCYSLLTKELLIASTTVGLDGMLGFYHQPHFGRPGLALDLMEEFRPVIADSVVINALNTGVVQSDDFVRSADAVALTTPGRKRFIQAFERRMDQLVTHPVFDYRISYRRVLEVQARLLTRFLLRELTT
ncbi:MAG TPA: CRISPR-associated endonuclease Cas1, partial [Polyangiaceae bacterium]|nr:CRISPR-associated endonuclease Cas1 [Polyangiaceae bacterium]